MVINWVTRETLINEILDRILDGEELTTDLKQLLIDMSNG
jgi:hypothetical protein